MSLLRGHQMDRLHLGGRDRRGKVDLNEEDVVVHPDDEAQAMVHLFGGIYNIDETSFVKTFFIV